jgi:CRISPR-associated protein Csm4
MNIYKYELEFLGSTHFGETGIELENVCERVSSDTLFSALLNAINVVYGEGKASELIEEFLKDPPFLISSLFLYGGETFYLPRPLFDEHLGDELKKSYGKELKKTLWLSDELFFKWISGTHIQEEDIERMRKDLANYKNSYTVEIRPRVSLDRATQNSNLYHCGYVHFKKGAGLYGLVAFKNDKYVDLFFDLLTNLGDIGIGGEKTYGSGVFKVERYERISGTFKEIFDLKSSRYVLLSLYHPAPDERMSLQSSAIAFEIIRKKGWIASGRRTLPLKRKSIGFFGEGSVFTFSPRGCLADVTPDSDPYRILAHRVFRYGYAFTVPAGG